MASMIASEFMGASLAAPTNGSRTSMRKTTVKKVAPKKTVKKVVKPATKKVVKKPVPKKVVKKAPVKKVAPIKKGAPRRGAGKVSGLSQWYGSDRKLFLPGGLLEPADVPSYLDGSLAGDYGFDILGLGKGGKVEEYRAFELIHARWAMLGAAGALIPEFLNTLGDGTFVTGAVWWETGAAMLDGGLLKYFGGTVPLPLFLVVALEVGLMGAVENFRSKQAGPKGLPYPAVETLHPGGRFDPLGFADDPDTFAELKVKEIKNGRLAMVSMLGFFVQAAVTKEGPYANWIQHVSDPFNYNLVTVVGSAERVPTL